MLIYLQMLESPEEKSILEQIYLEYRGLMYHVAYEILHNEQDAEDAVHHAFVKIAENIKKITDPVCPKTHSYVVTIVEHQAIDQYNIKYWYKCEGGKEIVSFILAIGGAVAAVLLFIATIPASTFVAACAMVGALITAVNAIWNIGTSYKALRAAQNGDPAWAKIYGDRNKVTDSLRAYNFNSGLANRISYLSASIVDGIELFCDIVNIVHLVGQMKSKFRFIQNYFDKNNGGLFTYFKEAKYTKVDNYDIWGNPCGKKWTLKVNEHGMVETRFTPRSVWRGIKAFVMDSPIDHNSDTGIRTLLNQNLRLDYKDWRSSFSIQGLKDTFRYAVTDGARVTYADWKNSFSLRGVAETIKYNFKYSSTRGMFTPGIEWKYRRDMIKTTANGIKSVISVTEKMGSVIEGSYNGWNEVTEKAYEFVDFLTGDNRTAVKKAFIKALENGQSMVPNTYSYKAAQAN